MIPEDLALYLEMNCVSNRQGMLRIFSHLAEYINQRFGVRCGRNYIFDLTARDRDTKTQRNVVVKYKSLNKFLDNIHLKSYICGDREYIFMIDRARDCFTIDIAYIEVVK